MENKKVFITGVTGALGQDLIHRYLETGDETLYLLIRRKKRLSHWDRARKILAKNNREHLLGTRVHVLEGDVTSLGFGLKESEIDMLRENVSHLVHVAALTALNGSEADCNRININGTEHALELARDFHTNGKLERFFYFSTAYVAGSRQTYESQEDGLPENPAFANFYESSKYMAETKVREAMDAGLPATIFRPSIVVGDSQTGKVAEFNVIYPFMKLFAHGILKTLPTRPESSFNIVPCDFVVNSAVALSRMTESLGKTFHLVSDNAPTIGMMFRLKNELYPEMPEIKMVTPEEFKPGKLDLMGQMAYKMLEPYIGYLNDNLTFDTTNTHALLDGSDIEFPDTDYCFLQRMVGYAVDEGYLIPG